MQEPSSIAQQQTEEGWWCATEALLVTRFPFREWAAREREAALNIPNQFPTTTSYLPEVNVRVEACKRGNFSHFRSNEGEQEDEEEEDYRLLYQYDVFPSVCAFFAESGVEGVRPPTGIEVYPKYNTIVLGFATNADTQAALLFTNSRSHASHFCGISYLVATIVHASSELGQGEREETHHQKSTSFPTNSLPPSSPRLSCCSAYHRLRIAIPPQERKVLLWYYPSLIWARCNLPRMRGFIGASLTYERVPSTIIEEGRRQQAGQTFIGDEEEMLVIHFKTAEDAERIFYLMAKQGHFVRILL